MVYKEIFNRGLCPNMIRRGNKLIDLSVKSSREYSITETIFRDSYNLTHMPLSQFTKAFGLEGIDEKMYFPYLYCREENFDTILNHLPPIEDYTPDSKKPKDREKLLKWYHQHQNNHFNLKEKLAEYCMSDVEILMHGLLKMREEFLAITKCEPTVEEEALLGESDEEIGEKNYAGYDILLQATTIASAAMQIYSLKYMKPDTVGIVPENCYNTFNDNQSEMALRFLKYIEETTGENIQTAESPEGEYVVPGTEYKLDGYIKANEGQPDIALEFHGCAWHAHEKCFPDPMEIMPSGKTAGQIRERHNKRMERIKQSENLEVHEYWECEIRQMLQRDKEFKKKYESYVVTTPALHIRNGFVGGRTAPARSYFQAKDGYIIKYKDYTSLYPWTQTTEYPIKHPEMIVIEKACRDVNWTKPEDIPWKGFLKVLVLCPRTVNPPVTVLPIKLDDRLLFSTCPRCPLDYPAGARLGKFNYRLIKSIFII